MPEGRPALTAQRVVSYRLAFAVGARPMVLDCWSFATGRQRLPDVVDSLVAGRSRAEQSPPALAPLGRRPPER